MEEFKALNEQLEKFLEAKEKYNLTIITGRDRDSIGDVTKKTFNAKNDLDALLYVFKNYKLQNAGMFNGDYEEDELEDKDIELKNNILKCVKEDKVEEGIKLLTDLYFDNLDISDYYDDIVKLEGPNGVVIEDDLNLSDWEDEEEQFDKADFFVDTQDDDKEERIKRAKEQEKVVLDMSKDIENLLTVKYHTIYPFSGLLVDLKISGDEEYFVVASIESNSDITAYNVKVLGPDPHNPYIGQKRLKDASIEEVKQFLIDNYDQMIERRTNIINKGMK